jgi:hypothetical protein
VILDDRIRAEMASGRYHDQRRASFGAPASLEHGKRDNGPTPRTPIPERPARQPRATPKPARQPWSRSQEKLALLHNEQGIRPDEIARRLGLSTYTVTQIILSGRTRRRR